MDEHAVNKLRRAEPVDARNGSDDDHVAASRVERAGGSCAAVELI